MTRKLNTWKKTETTLEMKTNRYQCKLVGFVWQVDTWDVDDKEGCVFFIMEENLEMTPEEDWPRLIEVEDWAAGGEYIALCRRWS